MAEDVAIVNPPPERGSGRPRLPGATAESPASSVPLTAARGAIANARAGGRGDPHELLRRLAQRRDALDQDLSQRVREPARRGIGGEQFLGEEGVPTSAA